MDALLGVLAGASLIVGSFIIGMGLSNTGTDLEIVLGAIFLLIATIAFVGRAIIKQMRTKT